VRRSVVVRRREPGHAAGRVRAAGRGGGRPLRCGAAVRRCEPCEAPFGYSHPACPRAGYLYPARARATLYLAARHTTHLTYAAQVARALAGAYAAASLSLPAAGRAGRAGGARGAVCEVYRGGGPERRKGTAVRCDSQQHSEGGRQNARTQMQPSSATSRTCVLSGLHACAKAPTFAATHLSTSGNLAPVSDARVELGCAELRVWGPRE
jgi:hypothetical protein